MPTLLVVDDEPNVLYSIEKSLRSDDLDVLTAPDRQGGHRAGRAAAARRRHPRRAACPTCRAWTSSTSIRQIDPRLPVIVITAYATTETAIEAMKRGAFEYLLKPVDFHQLREVVDKALELSRLRHVPAVFERGAGRRTRGSIASSAVSPAMQEVYKAIGRVAPRT